MHSNKPHSIEKRMAALYAEQTAQPTPERCAELASKVSLTLPDWEVLTGVNQPKFGMYEISKSGVKPRAEVVGKDEVAVLKFPCSPRSLVAFVDRADVGGKHFEVPEAFRHAASERANFISWYDEVLDAKFWIDRVRLSSTEAATLLCAQNPGDATCNPRELSTDETSPKDFARLVRAFEELEQTQPRDRSLYEWFISAQAQKLKYHSWIDKYLEAAGGSSQEDQAQHQGEAEAVTQESEQPVGIELEFEQRQTCDQWQKRSRANGKATKKDAMRLELDEIVQDMIKRGERVTPVSVMTKLKASAGKGGCVVDVATDGDGVVWERSGGTSETLKMKALEGRLSRMLKSTC